MTNKLKISFNVFIYICFSLNVFGIVYGEDSQTISYKNTKGKRSFIQGVDGYAFLSENMTLAETREAAFVNAKRQALEMTVTYIQSKTTFENLELVEDRIDATSEGAVTVIEQKDFGVENNTRYHVWIKAEVEYGIKSHANKDVLDFSMNETFPLTIKVWTSKEKYSEGDSIEVYLKGNKDFYARVVDISSDGKIIQLLPNEFRQDHLFKAGNTYIIPDKNDKFKLMATPPYGADKIVVYASEVQLGPVPMKKIGNGLHQYKGTAESFAMKTRGIKIAPVDNERNLIADFYEATCIITIEK